MKGIVAINICLSQRGDTRYYLLCSVRMTNFLKCLTWNYVVRVRFYITAKWWYLQYINAFWVFVIFEVFSCYDNFKFNTKTVVFYYNLFWPVKYFFNWLFFQGMQSQFKEYFFFRIQVSEMLLYTLEAFKRSLSLSPYMSSCRQVCFKLINLQLKLFVCSSNLPITKAIFYCFHKSVVLKIVLNNSYRIQNMIPIELCI